MNFRLAAALLVPLLVLTSRIGAAAGETPTFTSSLDVGLGTADEDWLVSFIAKQGLEVGGLEIVLAAPIRLVISDSAPEQEGVIRHEDWDDPSDLARVAPMISYERELDDGFVVVFLGELDGVGVGHGSAMDHYYNSTDMDHYKGGLRLHVDWAANGLEAVTDNVISPKILLGRAYITPLGWFIDGSWPRRLELGFTLGADIRAPRRTTNTSDTSIPMTGADLTVTILDNEIVELASYADLMVMDGSIGLHLGLASSFALSRAKEILLHLRGEYRRSGWDYHPAVFNPFYDRNRRHFGHDPVTDSDHTLADALAVEDSSDSYANGLMAEATLDWSARVRLIARYDREGEDRPHWLLLRLEVAPSSRFDLGLFYAGQDLTGGGDIFDANSLMGAGIRFAVAGPLLVFSEYTRRWRRVGENMPAANESIFGAGLHISY